MTTAKARETQRDHVYRVLAKDWKNEYKPRNLTNAFLAIRNENIPQRDEAALRKEFFAYAAEIDRAWSTNPDRMGKTLLQLEFPGQPLMQKYF